MKGDDRRGYIVGCHNSLRAPICWRCEYRRLFPRKHTSTQLSDVLIRSSNHIGWEYLEQMDRNPLTLAPNKQNQRLGMIIMATDSQQEIEAKYQPVRQSVENLEINWHRKQLHQKPRERCRKTTKIVRVLFCRTQ